MPPNFAAQDEFSLWLTLLAAMPVLCRDYFASFGIFEQEFVFLAKEFSQILATFVKFKHFVKILAKTR